VLNETAELLGLSLRMTEDQLTRDMMSATATMYNCTGGGNGDLPSNLSIADIDEVTSALLTNDAWMVLDTIGGEDKFGKLCAELKSSLIDLKAEVAIS
jgi:hypothetical protein